MFKDTPEGQTHSYNDGCGMPEHNNQSVDRQQVMEELVKGLVERLKQMQKNELVYEKPTQVNGLAKKKRLVTTKPYKTPLN